MGALSLTRRNTREVRATFYSRLSQYGPHGPGQHARFARPGQPARFHHDPSIPHSGVRSAGDSIYDEFLTGELFFTVAYREPISGQSDSTPPVYCECAEGYEDPREYVYLLQKSLYGMIQSP